MDTDRIKGKWKEVKGQVKQRWGKLTDDDLQQSEGRAEELAGRIQNRYGVGKDQARREVDDFFNSL